MLGVVVLQSLQSHMLVTACLSFELATPAAGRLHYIVKIRQGDVV